MQLLDFSSQRFDKQRHQAADFVLGSCPVFAAESEQCQVFNAPLCCGFHGRTNRFDTGPMARVTRLFPALRPAAVAIHDDRNVSWHVCVSDRQWGRQPRSLDLHQLRFFVCKDLVNLRNVFVGNGLDFAFARRSSSSPIIFSFNSSLTSCRASRRILRTRNSAALGLVANHTNHVFAPFFRQRRQRHANYRSGRRRIKPRSELMMAFSIA